MNSKDFGSQSPGQLTEITPFWGGNYCFDPAPLPPEWEFPTELWPLLNEASKQLMLLEGIGRNLPNPALILKPLRDREAILSSAMEGTFATPRQLLLYELEPREVASDTDPVNQHREVSNYARALDHAMNSPLPICLPLIRQLHQILMDGVRGEDKTPGQFRTRQVAIGAGARFIPPPPDRLADFLGDLDGYLHLEKRCYDPLVDCFLVHYQIETIHPFLDGNGRVGRLMLTLMIQRWCGMSRPWLHMSEFFDGAMGGKEQYCGALYSISAEGDWQRWIAYCLRGVAQQAKETIDRCERLRALREDYLSRLQNTRGTTRLPNIVEGLFDSPIVAIANLPERLGITYPTAKADIKKLANLGIVDELPDYYPKTYYAPEVYEIIYEGLED